MKPVPGSGDEAVLGTMLARRAAERPDHVYALFADGASWTFADAYGEALEAASVLAGQGLKRGDRILLWVPNGPDFLRLWMGANLLGAVVAPPNLAYRGRMLQHVVSLVEPHLLVVSAELAGRLAEIDPGGVGKVLTLGGDPRSVAGCESASWEAAGREAITPELPELHAWDTQLIMFTSGTTGASKGVIVPYGQMHALARTHYGDRFGPGDRYALNLPLFHVGGLLIATGALMTGGSILVMPGFKTATFWDSVRRWNVTGCTLIGAAASFLERQPPSASDADNPLRWVSVFPLVRDPQAFERRFGVKIFTGYGMSELSIPITTRALRDSSSAGQLRDDYEAQIVDEHDFPLPDGEAGELVLRPRKPWIVAQGYWRDPQATAAAWRNGWFHTGDRFRRTPEGDYYFQDRVRDAIRRRGENISSQEVENEILAHPGVEEVAVIGIPSEHGEQEVMAVVVPAENGRLTAQALRAFLEPRMPRFMLPRYVRFVETLPRNPSLRVLKHILRDQGITETTCDLGY